MRVLVYTHFFLQLVRFSITIDGVLKEALPAVFFLGYTVP